MPRSRPFVIHLSVEAGGIASSCSQRQTALSLMRATNPERSACRATSATLSRDKSDRLLETEMPP